MDEVEQEAPVPETKVEHRNRMDRVFRRAALALAVGFTAYAAIVSTVSVQKSNDSLDLTRRVAFCNTSVLGRALTVLNERSTYTKAQADSNLDLQKAQAALLLPSIQGKVPTQEESTAALKRYFDALTKFVSAAEESKAKAATTPYPNEKDIAQCIARKNDPVPLTK